MQHHQAGRLRKAQAIYNRVLQVEPANVDALHLLGLVTRQFGNYGAAVGLIEQAIKLNPNVPMFHNNLAETCRAMDKLEEAITHSKQALALQPGFPEASFNLGMALRAQGKLEEAIACFEQAVRAKPDLIEAQAALAETLHKQGKSDAALAVYQKALARYPDNPTLLSSMGIVLRAMGRVDEAIAQYKKAIAARPDIPELYNNLGIAYMAQRNLSDAAEYFRKGAAYAYARGRYAGNFSEAAECFSKVLELQPNNDIARHLLSALQQEVTDHAPRGYVQEIFDDYAQTFDQHLTRKLEYQVPQLLGAAIKELLGEHGQKLDVLDLGCGTGLVGREIRDISRRLAGVDLSPKMIAKARERAIYDDLAVDDVADCMAKQAQGCFDLITSADVFIYIGNLQSIFEHGQRILRPGGLFAFSLEALADESREFILAPTGRYQQSRTYIDNLSRRFNFAEARFSPIKVRKEEGKPVSGYIYLLRKLGD